jgi:hypothetical protein
LRIRNAVFVVAILPRFIAFFGAAVRLAEAPSFSDIAPIALTTTSIRRALSTSLVA